MKTGTPLAVDAFGEITAEAALLGGDDGVEPGAAHAPSNTAAATINTGVRVDRREPRLTR